MAFTRNLDPIEAMGIGIVHEIDTLLVSLLRSTHFKSDIPFYSKRLKMDKNKGIAEMIITDGNLILEDFSIRDEIKQKFNYELKLVKTGKGNYVILNDLSLDVLYSRLKKYYFKILRVYHGKISAGKIDLELNEPTKEHIKASEKYIKNLPKIPSLAQIQDLSEQVLSGLLEYAFASQDEFGVKMYLYANQLKNNAPFYEYLGKLKNLFPKLTANKIETLRINFLLTEKHWRYNLGCFVRKQNYPIRKFTREIVIKYLLICEASPASGKYFYKSTDIGLFKKVWKTFFLNDVCNNPEDAYWCLLDRGFLLIDTLPYSMSYTSRDREKEEYDDLIKSCLPFWLNKLNKHVSFSHDLKVAFGFKLNALSVLNACNQVLTLNSINYQISQNDIAASGSGQPITKNLERIFGTQNIKQNCNP